MDGSIKFESLDTSYVNLESLIRYLRDHDFVGRLHLALDQYEADVFLYGADSPSVWESDHATGSGAQGDAAMERLLVRALEPRGLITIYERRLTEEVAAPEPEQPTAFVPDKAMIIEPELQAEEMREQPTPWVPDKATISEPEPQVAAVPEQAAESDPIIETLSDLEAAIEATRLEPPAENVDWYKLLRISGELIAAVERAIESAGGNFSEYFRAVRVELGDDYPFLDPSVGEFNYANAVVQLQGRPQASAFIASLTEGLRRTVNKLASDDRNGAHLRERVALELAVAARKHGTSMSEFSPHLDRIAGTRVL